MPKGTQVVDPEFVRLMEAFERYLRDVRSGAGSLTMEYEGGATRIRDERGDEWVLIPRGDLEMFVGMLDGMERPDLTLTVDVVALLDGIAGRYR